MNAATGHSNPQHAELDRIRSRTPARLAVAALVTLVAAAGVWGVVAAVRSIETYKHAQRLERAVEQARYALALERSAVRDPQPARARSEVRVAAQAFAADVRLVRDAGRSGDRALAARLQRDHHRLLATVPRILDARSAGTTAAATLLAHATFDPAASHLDATLAGELAALRGQGAASWPAEPVQRLALGGIALLVSLGLLSSAVLLLRLVGYKRRLEKERQEELARLEQAASTDNLTGLGNRRAFYEDLKREIARRSRSGAFFSLVMLDLDGLKDINDTLGHPAGDERIRAVAACLQATVRGSDGAYRTGGDEFMALLPGERAWGAFTFAQRLQAEVARHRTPVGVSCGVVESVALESAEMLVHRADLALYDAKRCGRRIVIYSEGLEHQSDRPEDRASRRHHRLLATALAHAVDAKDAATRNHCETVSTLCVLMGQALGLDGERVEQLQLAGLLHDVGKIGVADALLQKPTALDADERTTMTSHVEVGYAIVSAAGLPLEADWVRHHHEHFGGSGYPDGLGGEGIPLESRIILVADAFEAMTAERPYRHARSPEEAFLELERGSGTQFDPDCVAALRTALEPQVSVLSPRLVRTDAPAAELHIETTPQAASA